MATVEHVQLHDGPVSYEQLGRAADTASMAHQRALAWVQGLGGPGGATAAITISIPAARWDDGTLQLQEALQHVLPEHVVELLQLALARLGAEAQARTDAMRLAFTGDRTAATTLATTSAPVVAGTQLGSGEPPALPAALATQVPVVNDEARAAAASLTGPQRDILFHLLDNSPATMVNSADRELLEKSLRMIAPEGVGMHRKFALTETGRAVALFVSGRAL